MTLWTAFPSLALLLFSSSFLLAAECRGRSEAPMVKLLQPPPCDSCEETKAEMAELLELERSRSPDAERQAREDVQRNVARFLEGAKIPFDSMKLAACEDFFQRRRMEEKAMVDAAKDSFCRLRPFLSPGNILHPVQEARPDDSFSYPSGHATYGATLGLLLTEMLPEKRAELYGRVNDYARNRMVAGVHYRSDVEAGKLFGAAIAIAFLAKPDARPEFEEAKSCIRKAVGMP